MKRSSVSLAIGLASWMASSPLLAAERPPSMATIARLDGARHCGGA